MPERYQIVVEAAGPGPPGIVRLKRTLKALLRWAGMKCVEVRQIEVTDNKRSKPDENDG
jgi:hypothetical protein